MKKLFLIAAFAMLFCGGLSAEMCAKCGMDPCPCGAAPCDAGSMREDREDACDDIGMAQEDIEQEDASEHEAVHPGLE